MPVKTPSPRRRPAASKQNSIVEIVVRRGASRRFKALKTQTSKLPVIVSWDRRETDRRTKANPHMQVPRDRRAADRRQAPPFTWDLADFVVVAPVPGGAGAGKRKAKKPQR